MDLKYIDIHSHLDFSQFDEDRGQVISRMNEAGVGTITVGTSAETSQRAVDLAKTTDNIWSSIGVHPTEEDLSFPTDLFESLVKEEKVVGVGECGFDYFRTPREGVKDKQEKLFVEHIEFAQKHDLPLILHIRPSKGSQDAYEDAISLLEGFNGLRGVSHFFVGDSSTAGRFIDKGFGISFDGPITFTEEYNNVVRFIPEEFLHAETDAPFAAPEPFRGKRNEPSYVVHVVSALAKIRGEDVGALEGRLLQNAIDLFEL